ncbi:MAG: Flp pilus assembly protein CpaB [Oscillospiraceae bacterium]|nr:Flp pilus assembly protein CpaB [Oscillospiraceae bacterium]
MFKKKSTRDRVVSVPKRGGSLPENDGYTGAGCAAVPSDKKSLEKPPVIKVRRDPKPDDTCTGTAIPENESFAGNTDKPGKAKKRRAKREKEKVPRTTKPFLKSRPAWAIISVSLAIVIAFVLMPAMERAGTETVTIIAAAQDISEGTRIESGMLQTKECCKADLPKGAVKSSDAATGQYALMDMMQGDILIEAKIGDIYSEDAYLNGIPDGKMAMSVELSDMAQSVSGKLRGGDVIRIYAVYKDSDSPLDSSSLVDELQYVEVLAVTNGYVQDIKGSESPEDESSGSSKESKSIATVTLLVNNRQAVVLSGLSETATMYSALVVRGDEIKKEAALETQDKYLEQLDKKISEEAEQ